MSQKNILLVGESWETFSIHIKGFDTFYTSKYEEGADWLIQALNEYNYNLDFIPNHRAASNFPTEKEELQKYDALILSDIGANTLLLHPDTFEKSIPTPNRLKLIKKYVERGGGFLMVGGYLSFQGIEGKAKYKDTPVEEILPVKLQKYDDRVETPAGIYPELVTKHPITEGIPKKFPMFLGYNRFSAKNDSKVLIEGNGDPFLVIGSFGEGRTAAFASDCAPHWGSPEFTEWEYYNRFWGQLLTWLTG